MSHELTNVRGSDSPDDIMVREMTSTGRTPNIDAVAVRNEQPSVTPG
jgi:hypothetical protein